VSKGAPDTVTLRISEIVRDLEWNCRDAIAASNSDNDALAANIEARGLLQPPRVRQLEDGRFALVHGFRRVAACEQLDPDMEILCTLQEPTGDEEEDELEATAANLAENIRRQRLAPFEIANTLHRLKKGRPDLTAGQIAEMAGMHPATARRYLKIRHSAGAELWELFCRYGERYPHGVNVADVAKVVTFPHDEQPAKWAELLKSRKQHGGKRKKGSKSPSSKAAKLRRYIEQVPELDASQDFRDGARWAFQVALGQRSWPEPATTGDEDGKDEDEDHAAE
jgi:ParB/RepB/Spo0J family partition protein